MESKDSRSTIKEIVYQVVLQYKQRHDVYKISYKTMDKTLDENL